MTKDELTNLVNKHDPAGLLRIGAPSDEYHSEVDELERELKTCDSIEDLAQFIYDQFYEISVDGGEPNWAKFKALSNDLWLKSREK